MFRITQANTLNQTAENPIELYLEDIDVKLNSKRIYRRQIMQFVDYLNKREIIEPTKTTIQEYKQHLIDEGKASITVSAYLVVLKAMYKWFEQSGICKDITVGVKLLKKSSMQKKDALTPEQTVKLLNSFDKNSELGLRDFTLINTMVHTGARAVELHRSNIGDIQQVGDHWVLFIQGKGCDSKEEILVLTESTLKVIREYLATRPFAKPSDPLFASISDRNTGNRLSTRTISKVCKDSLRRIGLDSVRLTGHSLRHTAITLALLGGSSMEQVQAMSRHKDIKILQMYAHHVDRIKQAPENSIDDVLGKVA